MFALAPLSVSEIAAYAAGGVILIGAFFAGIVSLITAMKVTRIEAHVNSEKTAAEGRENTLKAENSLLREMLTEKKQTAALLAQAALTIPSVASGGADSTLLKVEHNTKETAENTARVEAKVEDLKK